MVRRKKNSRLKNVNEYLTRRYFDPKRPAAYTSLSKLSQAIAREGKYRIKPDEIKEWGLGQDIITQTTAPITKKKGNRRVVVGPKLHSVWDSDMLQLNSPRFTKANSGMAYILVCVDILSRQCMAEPVKSKQGKDVAQAFQTIFDRRQIKPKSLRVDRGREFYNHIVKALMKKNNINMYSTHSGVKANYCEILIKQLKRRLFRMFQHTGSYNYTKSLQDIVKSYNSTYHTSIKMAPQAVNEANALNLWYKTYFPSKDYLDGFVKAHADYGDGKGAKFKANAETIHDRKFKYKVGDTVRVAYSRSNFSRDYDNIFSGEIFSIVRRKLEDNKIPIYFIKDYSDSPVAGGFLEEELRLVKFDPKGLFKIDKVLAHRTYKGKKQTKVTFENWPESYASWVDNSTIKNINKKNTKK